MDKNLYYCPKDKRVFEVVGYSSIDNSTNVKDQISTLQNNYNYYSKLFGTKTIETLVVTNSTRFKQMRVFYADNIESDKVPKEAYVLKDDWTMHKWLAN
jgi:hypothetical protein